MISFEKFSFREGFSWPRPKWFGSVSFAFGLLSGILLLAIASLMLALFWSMHWISEKGADWFGKLEIMGWRLVRAKNPS